MRIMQGPPWTAEKQAAHVRLIEAGRVWEVAHRAYHACTTIEAAQSAGAIEAIAHAEFLAAREAMSAASKPWGP